MKLDVLWMNLVGVIKSEFILKNKLEVIISWVVQHLSKTPKSSYQRSFLKLYEAQHLHSRVRLSSTDHRKFLGTRISWENRGESRWVDCLKWII